MEGSNYTTVAALDFGTSYSGYAFSSLSEFQNDPLNIQVNETWGTGQTMLSIKSPKCILLNNNKEFQCFGYDAEYMYEDICTKGNRSESYFFYGLNIEVAGIPTDQLSMVTETEAAFLYVQTLHRREHKQTLKDNKEYMVVDLGGEKVIQELIKDTPYEYLNLWTEFERVKIKADIRNENRITVRLPHALLRACYNNNGQDLSSVILRTGFSLKIELRNNKMKIDSNLFKSFFEPTIEDLIKEMEEVFRDYRHADDQPDIIMVGGFTECTLVQDVLQTKFYDKNFIIPKGAEVAVIEGAVLCGHQPYRESIIPPLQRLSNSILTNLSQLSRGDFNDLVALGTFASYENKVYLAGPCNTGKSSLASILIGENIPKTWFSTDGLIIHFGRNGIDLLKRKMIPLQIDSPLKFDQKRQRYTARHIQADVLDKIKQGTYVMNIAPSDLVDFGGQKSFDMTHQLFIQHKGTFILMFDGRKGLYTSLEEYQPGNVTAASILEHWINSVLTYCTYSDDKMPRFMFAATHSDQFSKDTKEKLTSQFQEGLTKLFSSHKLHEHIMYDRVFFINATDAADIHIGHLKDSLVDIAFEQSTWGQQMPIVWVPLDLQLSDLKAEGVKLITKEAILEINNSNQEFALSARRLEDFLLVQHSIGKLLYFDEPALRDFIVIQPAAMVNILRAFITDKMFWPSEGPLRKILENVSSTGVLKKTDLFALWSQPAYKDIMTDTKTKEYVVQVLLHLDILVEPKRYLGNDIASNLFLVPCMVKVNVPQQILNHAADDQTICIAYHLKETVIPSALSFKLIGASVTAIMDADSRNELQIHVKGQRIVAYLINEVSKQLISPDLATTTQECLTLALERSLQFYCRCFGKTEQQGQSDLFEIEVGEVCQGEICVIPVSDAKRQSHWRCKNGKTHQTRSSLNWVYDKVHREDHSLAGVELGLSIGNIKEAMFNFPRDLNGQIHAILTKWKDRNNTNRPIPTIYRLMVALKRIEAAEDWPL
ncbi:unnamed protein product [Mytilus edulis]|uniref:Death domain-containing protein n=1 Tax=Mytilus edulis TaxID=6550 RepID=A0A8S3UNX4_MYTED|nr:unnamed protein product [Mytilus edulis]